MKIRVHIGFLYLLNRNIQFILIVYFGVEHIPKEINKYIRSKELGHAVRNDIKRMYI